MITFLSPAYYLTITKWLQSIKIQKEFFKAKHNRMHFENSFHLKEKQQKNHQFYVFLPVTLLGDLIICDYES